MTYPFALWVLEGTLVKKDGLDAGRWRSFLVQLRGQKNTCRMPVPGHSRPLSGYAGPEGVTAASALAGASSFQTSGWTPGVPVLAEGDYFTVNDELKLCTSSAASAGNSVALLTFEPALRRPVPAGETIHVYDPWCLMSAQDDQQGGWALSRPVQHDIKLKLMEAFEG